MPPGRKNRKKGKMKKNTLTGWHNEEEEKDEFPQFMLEKLSEAGIPLSATRTDSFKAFVQAVRRFGPGLEPPTIEDLGGPILDNKIAKTNDLMKSLMEECTRYGCSIMLDGWTDRKNRVLVNCLVNNPMRTMFLESVDASLCTDNGETMLVVLEKIVEKIGQKNVVQVIAEPSCDYATTGKILEAKWSHLYWTPCASHCINLMLEDISHLPGITNTLKMAITVNSFIHNHPEVLNMMRQFTNRSKLIRPGITRFVTSFLTLRNIYDHKEKLKSMFTSDKWLNSTWAEGDKWKEAQDIVSMPSFWNGIVYALKVTTPLLCVLRLVNNEKKPAMGYIYQAMDRAKDAMKVAFDDNTDKYKLISDIIDKRWNCQRGRPLYAAGYFLNPEIYYNSRNVEENNETVKGFYDCIAKLVPDENERGKIIEESLFYKEARDTFGTELAVKHRKTLAPVEWWRAYGGSSLNLQRLAIGILSLRCSSWSCVNYCNMYTPVGAEELTEVEQRRSNDLLYVRYNMRLQERFNHLDTTDPISVIDIDDGNEWLVGWTDYARNDPVDECIGKEAVLEDTNEEEYFEQDDQSFDYRGEEDDVSYLTRLLNDKLED